MATYKEAYEWMLRVQKACLGKPVSVSIDAQYTPEIDKHSLDMFVHYNDETFRCPWYPWSSEKEFVADKKVILALLHGIGITLYPKKK